MAIRQDVIEIEVITDGTIKIITDPISQANHTNADRLIKEMARLAGGAVETEKRGRGHVHHHHHEHGHDHHGHSH